ncbi:MAG: hypothetical protein HQ402_03490 [Parcubacteria group bacterium]|nr:hypothetical protein [Parcubacteria group bacterium]
MNIKHKRKILPVVIFGFFAFTPFFVFAVAQPTNFKGFVGIIIGIVNLLIPVLVGLAILSFFWGLVKFIKAGGSEDSVKEGKSLMIWGVISLFVMISIWGILAFFTNSFGFGAFHLLPENAPTAGTSGGAPYCADIPADQIGSVPCI